MFELLRELTPQVIADVDAHAVDVVRKRLADGSLIDGLAPLDVAHTVGIGHSAGAIVTVHLQARHRPYDALVLLGFGGRGWREQLTDAELAIADDPDAIRAQIVDARNAGSAVLLISEDLDELLELSDRLGVIFDGHIVFETRPGQTDSTEIGRHMAGQHAAH